MPKPQPIPDGLIVMFEGLDGVGKSTQLRRAAKALEKQGWQVHTTRNLGGTPIGEALREAMLAKLARPAATDFYISLAIQEALIAELEAQRQAGKLVLIDRGPLSLAAYQIYGSGFDEAQGWQAVDNGMQSIHPELIVSYKSQIKTAVERAHHESGTPDYFESKPLDFFKRVAHGYEVAAERYPIRFINANRSIEAIHEDTMQLIEAAITSKLRYS
ncbi:MAG TPA: dTMP kinase [Candidatus Saccharimonadales bacterium]|nr:dTMP kinase [Candidatus Saccharimonadales bacterium]